LGFTTVIDSEAGHLGEALRLAFATAAAATDRVDAPQF
ncbi:MAG: hypothetical protein RI885_2352, partial [Actinomycetota bacterium]